MMFTQKKGWPLTPSSADKNELLLANPRSLRGSVYGKGKGVVGSDLPPPPPQGFLGEKGCDAGENAAEIQVWKTFTEAGMLDEASLARKDKEALIERVANLETELYDYQYNMGLLLMEKKEWTSKYKDFDERLGEAEVILKREQASHWNAISEMERREENLRKALGVEKQCVIDLENALREMLSQQSDVKIKSDANLAEAQALKENFENKSLVVESKLHAADARLAEVSRKNSEVERNLHDLAVREDILQREQVSLSKEKALQSDDIAKQREDLQAWEKNLRDGQERLVESQSLLNQREKRFNDSHNVLMRKEREIEILKQTVESSNSSLKEKEDYINIRLTALATEEKDIESQVDNLQKKEKGLIAKEEKLNNREAVEIQKLVDDNKSAMDSKMHDFEMELSKKRKSFDEEQHGKLVGIEEKEIEMKQKEEKILKREQALEKKIEILNVGKKEHDVKEKSLKKLEKALKTEGMEIQKKTKQHTEDYQQLLTLKEEIDATKKAVETENLRLLSQQDSLKLTEKERAEHFDLQLKLKQEIDECRIIKESLAAEQKELRGERAKFEREWEALDEKIAALAVDAKKVANEKEFLDKWKHVEELRLKNEQKVGKDEIQKEAADLKLKKEAFDANIAHERSENFEMLERERADMVRELDLLKHKVKIDMQKKLQELESEYHQKEADFNDHRKRELDRIKTLRDLSASETQKMKMEQNSLESAKHEYITQRKKLEEDQKEIRSDIDTLRSLNKSLKEQREEFVKEREYFLSQKCKSCGVQVELVISDLRPVNEIVDPDNVLLSSLADFSADHPKDNSTSDMSPVANVSQSGVSGSRISWIKRCREKIFKFSPDRIIEDSAGNIQPENSKLPDKPTDNADADFVVVTGAPKDFNEASKDGGVVLPCSVLEKSAEIQRNDSDNGVPETISKCDTLSVNEQNEIHSLSPLAEEGFETQVAKQKLRRGGKCGRTKKKTTKKTDNDESQGDSIHTEKTISLGQKRNFSQTSGNVADDADSEAHSESISLGGRRKRRQIVAPEPQPAREKRYNFRKSTLVGTVQAAQALTPKTKRGKPKGRQQSDATNEQADDVLRENEVISNCVPPLVRDEKLSQRTTAPDNTVEIHESSFEKAEDAKVMQMENDAEHSGQEIPKLNAEESISILAEQDKRGSETESGEYSDSDSEKHNASVSKRLWKFFTS